MKINDYFVILFFFFNLAYSFFLPSVLKLYAIKYKWKAETSFRGFGALFYQSKY